MFRVDCWQYCQYIVRHDKAGRLGYRAKQEYVIYQVPIRRGGLQEASTQKCGLRKTNKPGFQPVEIQTLSPICHRGTGWS